MAAHAVPRLPRKWCGSLSVDRFRPLLQPRRTQCRLRLTMSDQEDLFADSDSDDTNELIASTMKKKEDKDEGGLFDSDSEDEKPPSKAAKRARLEALAKKREKPKAAPAGAGEKEKGYESGDSYDSSNFQRTKEDDDFLDTTGEDAEAVKELYADQHFDDQRPDKEVVKKKRKYGNDEAEEDNGDRVPDNPIMAAVHRMKKKKRVKQSFGELEDQARALITKMEEAADDDEEAVRHRVPATAKLQLLPTVLEQLTRKDLQRLLLDLDVLAACKRWIQPLHNGQLGNVTIRQRLLQTLSTLTGDTGITAHDLKRSGLGKAVMVLYKHRDETPALKRQHKKLVEQWSRPIFAKSGNLRDLERAGRPEAGLAALAAAQRQPKEALNAGRAKQDINSLLKTGKKSGSESGVNRVRVPFSKGFAFSVRPMDRTDAGPTDNRRVQSPMKDTRGKLSKRMLEKGRTVSKNQRSANVSIEGRKAK